MVLWFCTITQAHGFFMSTFDWVWGGVLKPMGFTSVYYGNVQCTFHWLLDNNESADSKNNARNSLQKHIVVWASRALLRPRPFKAHFICTTLLHSVSKLTPKKFGPPHRNPECATEFMIASAHWHFDLCQTRRCTALRTFHLVITNFWF